MSHYRYVAEDGRTAQLMVPKGHYAPDTISVPMPDGSKVVFKVEREFDNTEIERRLQEFQRIVDTDEVLAHGIAFDLLADYVRSLNISRARRIALGLRLTPMRKTDDEGD